MSDSAPGWAGEVLAFWFDELSPDDWWGHSADLDAGIARRFGALWESEREREAADFLASAAEALAAVILFDQFPRNLFRGTARAFATDPLALAVARRAIERGFDEGMSEAQRQFLYMPFMHSEELADQERSVALFEALGDLEALAFAREHHDIVARFGRFPHRNAALGRATLPQEKEAAARGEDW